MNFINPSPCGTWLSERKKRATSLKITGETARFGSLYLVGVPQRRLLKAHL
jgi:hypothetical protein